MPTICHLSLQEEGGGKGGIDSIGTSDYSIAQPVVTRPALKLMSYLRSPTSMRIDDPMRPFLCSRPSQPCSIYSLQPFTDRPPSGPSIIFCRAQNQVQAAAGPRIPPRWAVTPWVVRDAVMNCSMTLQPSGRRGP